MSQDNKKISKFLSYVLRHKPESIGIKLDGNGWADVGELIKKSNHRLSLRTIQEVVRTNDKQRFILSEDKTRIRANQGHSVKIDLGLTQTTPPKHLYHGTATRFVKAIMEQGLRPMNRNHVHLSADLKTARTVGSRHGKVIILTISTEKMHADGHKFFLSENKVWLTKAVPVQYINTSREDAI